jgi:hypothetical protein
MKSSNFKVAFLQAVGLAAYISILVSIMNATHDFNIESHVGPLLAGILMLTLFVFSALVSGLIILGRPVFLFANGKKRDAVTIVIMSAGWLLVFLIVLSFLIISLG